MKKNYLKIVLVNFIFVFTCFNHLFSQQKYCGTTEAMNEVYKLHPELKQKEAEYNAMIQQKIAMKKASRSMIENKYIIPVVFHVIHTNGPENISDLQIKDQINILNRDFRKLNADTSKIIKNTPFDTLAADINVEFRLAQIDPKGNCTNGIERIVSPLTNNASDLSKLNPWPREKYLNVWVVKSIGTSGNVAGYAYYPGLAPSPSVDGVIILSTYIGSIGTSNPTQSRALTHEVGHYLNLLHVWGNNNSPEVDCSGSDLVDDTPPTRGHLRCDNSPYCTIYTFVNTVYKFTNVTTTSGTIDPSTPPVNKGATFSKPKAVGVSENSSENGVFSFSKWDLGGAKINHGTNYDSLTGAINTTKYYEVTVGPKFGTSFSLTKLTFSFKRDSAGVRTFAVRSNLDNFANNLTASVDTSNKGISIKPGNVFFSINDTTAIQNGNRIALSIKDYTTPVTFRIYGWNAEDSTGTFGIDSLAFTGTSGLIENTQNYMDYSYCSVMFTKGQKNRMRATLESGIAGRSNLWTTTNLNATGINGNGVLCKPIIDFSTADIPIVCPNNSITFKSNVQNVLPGSPLEYLWEFEGGTPSTSTSANPSITYTDPGYYRVKLTVTNSAGSSSIEKWDFVYVRIADGEYGIWTGLTESFEDSIAVKTRWHVVNEGLNNYTWEINNNAASSGKNSMRMNGFKNAFGDVDLLISPYYNTYLLKDLTMSFKFTCGSSASYAADINDVLMVSYSLNCGQSWIVAANMKGTDLVASAGYQPNYYIPSSPSQWLTNSIKIPNLNGKKVVFKFEYTTGIKSNNLYIDDINLSGTVGIDENETSASSAVIYPNPTTDIAKVSYHLGNPAVVTLELTDILGKQITQINQGNQAEGDYAIDLSKQQLRLTTGIYFVKLTVGNSSITRKLVINE